MSFFVISLFMVIRTIRRIPRVWLMLGLIAIAIFIAANLTKVVLEMAGGENDQLHVIDQWILNFLFELRTPTLTLWAMNLTAMGSVPVLTSLVVFAFLLFWIRGDRRSAVHIAVASLGGAILTRSIKAWMQRPRPELIERLVEETSFSYPSGHSLASTAIYFTLSLIFAQILRTNKERVYAYVSAFILIGVIGLSRVYLAVHYPSDVAAGTSIGFAWALVVALCLSLRPERSGL